MKIVTVVGARPQFIKAAAVSREIAATHGVAERLVHTGQHHDANMSDTFFAELGIPAPAHRLGIAGLSHGAMTGRMLEALEAVMTEERPDVVLVYGDTNSTLAGALAAAKLHIPVAHVEAGLRSFNRAMPEEINRVLTDHCSDLLFTPTSTATRNLATEGVPADRVRQVGDVMYDAVLWFASDLPERPAILERHGLEARRYVLATIHRQETTDDPARLRAVVEGLATVAREMPVILPLHPRTRARIDSAGLRPVIGDATVIEPVGYRDMVALTSRAAVVATDSGGLQKEAFFQSVPCVTLRTETEWGELVDAGWNRLVPPNDATAIATAIAGAVGSSGRAEAPYGEGRAAAAILENLVSRLG